MALLSLFLIPTQGFSQSPTETQPTGGVERGVRLPTPVEAPPAGEAPQPAEETAAAAAEGGEELVYLNVNDQDLKDVIKQISKATGKNFIIDEKIRGKVTIISERQMTKEEAYQAFLSALEVAGYTVVTGPAGIIKIVSQRDAATYPIPIHVDSTPYTDSYITRLISLKNISAMEMSNAIKGLISKSGNLFAYPATNTLIITDSGANIDRLMKIIQELDQEGPQQIIEIIPIKYAKAKEVASTILNLFDKGGGSQAGPQRRPRGQGELEEVEDVSKIIADERTNALIVVASKRAITKVHDLIGRLDRPLSTGEAGTIHVHYLKYASAKELSSTLASITSGVKKGDKTGTDVGGVAQLEGGIAIGADETTNALIITASPKDYKVLVEELISKLDIPRRQVYLESTIMELAMTKGTDYGIRGFGGSVVGRLLGFGQTFAATGGIGSVFSQDGLVGGVIGRDTVTVNVPTFSGTQTTTQSVQLPAYAAFLNLLQTYTDANVVSSPNLLTLDNEQAEINITSKIYATKTTTIATGLQTTEPTPLESGLILKLTPQINEGDSVRLKIEQELSNFTGPPDQRTGAAPSTKRKVTTTVITNDGQTIVLGGLMQDNVTHGKRKVPILGDIPILGLLFRSSNSQSIKNNLLIFITPHVIRDPSDFSRVMQRKIEQRNQFIDENFGAKQRKVIRQTLAKHRSDLLEFVPASPAPPAESQPSAAAAAPPPAPPSSPAAASSPQAEAPSSAPVITVPSVDPRSQAPRPPASVAPPAPRTAPKNSKTSKVAPPPPPPELRTEPAGEQQTPKAPATLDLAY